LGTDHMITLTEIIYDLDIRPHISMDDSIDGRTFPGIQSDKKRTGSTHFNSMFTTALATVSTLLVVKSRKFGLRRCALVNILCSLPLHGSLAGGL
jgi:hypothetical protein